jgi:hypothetical protein
MSDTPVDSLIPYDEIVQEALRAVVGRVLGQVEAWGGELPGAHHFYITFKTAAPGVDIPAHLRERFPDEMTIVLQHQFWNLVVLEDQFSVELSFNDIPEKLTVPFAAIKGFFDPAVQFGLQFATDAEVEEEATEKPAAATTSAKPAKPSKSAIAKAEAATEGEDAPQKIVSLDSFRKK